MAQEYVVYKNSGDNTGLIGLSKAVFESIAAVSIRETEGVKLAKSTQLNKNVTCKVVNGIIYVDVRVLADADARINDISAVLQEKVSFNIKYMTDFKDIVVNVNVVGFYRERKENN